MAFPSTPTLDDYNRANGSLGSNYTQPIYNGDLGTATIFSNAVVCTASQFSSFAWNPATFLTCEAFCSYSSDEWVYNWTRVNNPNSGSMSGIAMRARNTGGNIELYLITGNAVVESDTGGTVTVPASGQMGVLTENVGADIVCKSYIDGSLVRTTTWTGAVSGRPEVAVAGYIGWGLYGAGNDLARSIDNAGGGTPGGTNYPIGFLGGVGW